MSSMSAYFATVFRLTWSIRAISDLERPAASIDRISFTVSRGTVISSILPGRARQSNRPGKPYGEGRAPGPRGAALLLKLLNFSCSRCLFPSDHSDHFLVNINTSSRHQLAGLKTYAVRYDQQPSLAPSSSSARTPCRNPRSRWQGNSAAAIEEPTQGRRPQSSKDFHRPLQAWIDLTVDLIRLNKPSMGRLTKCKVKKQIRPYAGAGFG